MTAFLGHWFPYRQGFFREKSRTRVNAVPTPFLPRLCLLVYFIWILQSTSICNTNVHYAFPNLKCVHLPFCLEKSTGYRSVAVLEGGYRGLQSLSLANSSPSEAPPMSAEFLHTCLPFSFKLI